MKARSRTNENFSTRPAPSVIASLAFAALAALAAGCDKPGICDFHIELTSSASTLKSYDRCMPDMRERLCIKNAIAAGNVPGNVTSARFTAGGTCAGRGKTCGDLPGTFSECPERASSSPGAASAVSTAAPLALPADAAPAPAYFNVSYDIGLVALDVDGTWVPIPNTKNVSLDGPFLASDGNAYLTIGRGESTNRELHRLKGTKLEKVASLPTAYAPCQAFDARDGKMIALCNDDAHLFDGKAWTKEKLPKLALGTVVIDGTGKPWYTSGADIFVRDADGWKKVDPPKDALNVYDYDVAVSGKDVFALSGNGAARWSGTAFERVGELLLPSVGSRPRSSGGLFAFGTIEDYKTHKPRVVLEDGRGGQRVIDSDVALAVPDRSGRIWAVVEGRLIVVDGAQKTEYPTGSIPLLEGMSSHAITVDLVVVGAGPKLAQLGEVKKASAVKGKIVLGDEPGANIPIQICPSPALYGDTPCAGNAVTFETTTNERGEFEIKDVPIGVYGLALHASSKWSVDVRALSDLKAGEIRDVGALKYTSW